MIDTGGILAQIGRIREKANSLIERQLIRSGITGVLPAHGPVLFMLLNHDGPVAMKQIIKHVRRTKSTVTSMIDTLEQHGYIRRFSSDSDGRIRYVELTTKGRSLKGEFERISRILLKRLYKGMSIADRHCLVRHLNQIEQNLDRSGSLIQAQGDRTCKTRPAKSQR